MAFSFRAIASDVTLVICSATLARAFLSRGLLWLYIPYGREKFSRWILCNKSCEIKINFSKKQTLWNCFICYCRISDRTHGRFYIIFLTIVRYWRSFRLLFTSLNIVYSSLNKSKFNLKRFILTSTVATMTPQMLENVLPKLFFSISKHFKSQDSAFTARWYSIKYRTEPLAESRRKILSQLSLSFIIHFIQNMQHKSDAYLGFCYQLGVLHFVTSIIFNCFAI